MPPLPPIVKEIVVNVFCSAVLAPILAVVIFAACWWGTMPSSYEPKPTAEVVPHNQNQTGSPPGETASRRSSIRPVSGRTLFLANCASCHGADGSGQGELVLDRPARSFKDGGFSFGNTIASIERVITSGIPGTPMPGFKATLDPRERRAVARYVQDLGPPQVKVNPDDTIMSVTDRPQVIRGELTPLVAGQPSHVRGLIAGNTDGLSWEYRTDDVRLLAVRQGDFVKRENWTGRSGEPVRPLGRMVRIVGGGDPGPSFMLKGKPVASRLLGTSIKNDHVSIRQQLVGTNIRISETGMSATVGTMAGYERMFQIDNPDQQKLDMPLHLESTPELIGTDQNGIVWYRSSGPGDLVELTGLQGSTLVDSSGDSIASLENGPKASVRIITLLAPEWTPQLQQALLGTEVSA
ncbi:MAG: c-type cytochrome [Phycisphaerales bacterium]|nr:c-type cytochrome [Phycisphaerales bacterium]